MSIRIDKYEVWVTTSLTDDQKMELSKTLSRMAEENKSRWRLGAVAKHIGVTSIDSFAQALS